MNQNTNLDRLTVPPATIATLKSNFHVCMRARMRATNFPILCEIKTSHTLEYKRIGTNLFRIRHFVPEPGYYFPLALPLEAPSRTIDIEHEQ